MWCLKREEVKAKLLRERLDQEPQEQSNVISRASLSLSLCRQYSYNVPQRWGREAEVSEMEIGDNEENGMIAASRYSS